jgi:hypothetical protein
MCSLACESSKGQEAKQCESELCEDPVLVSRPRDKRRRVSLPERSAEGQKAYGQSVMGQQPDGGIGRKTIVIVGRL